MRRYIQGEKQNEVDTPILPRKMKNATMLAYKETASPNQSEWMEAIIHEFESLEQGGTKINGQSTRRHQNGSIPLVL